VTMDRGAAEVGPLVSVFCLSFLHQEDRMVRCKYIGEGGPLSTRGVQVLRLEGEALIRNVTCLTNPVPLPQKLSFRRLGKRWSLQRVQDVDRVHVPKDCLRPAAITVPQPRVVPNEQASGRRSQSR
jgi:hypothetical protein